jgi:hypothetical protein
MRLAASFNWDREKPRLPPVDAGRASPIPLSMTIEGKC